MSIHPNLIPPVQNTHGGLSKVEALAAVQLALDKKAYNVVLLEIGEVVSYADFFLICSGKSTVQVRAIVDEIEQGLRQRGIRPLHIEGKSEGRWVLLDYDDVIIHVFHEESRQMYDIERLWYDVPRETFGEQDSLQTFEAIP